MLKSEESSIEVIAENVSKMLELVSGHRHRVIFLKILVDKVRYDHFYELIYSYTCLILCNIFNAHLL